MYLIDISYFKNAFGYWIASQTIFKWLKVNFPITKNISQYQGLSMSVF